MSSTILLIVLLLSTWITLIVLLTFILDLDQIIVDLKPENAEKLEKQEVDPDLPGLGQHYCISCSRYFVDARALSDHRKTKIHKRRVKALKEDIYTGPQQLIDNGKPIMRDESN